MKTPPDSKDPMLQSLVEEASDLPRRAAGEARRISGQRVKQRRQLALAMTVLFCGVCAWQVLPKMGMGRPSFTMHSPPNQPKHTASVSSHYLLVRTEEQARNEPLPLPEGLTKDQERVVIAAQGHPLLLIRNSSGKVSRIHVFER